MKNAEEIVRDAIVALRELASVELEQQNFNEVAKIALLADELTGIVGSSSTATPEVATSHEAQKRATSTRKSKKRRNYPRFERDDDKLVKIGWSKKAKDEYEHRAPYNIAEVLVVAIRKKFADGELFTAADILPIKDVPDYQSYLALKWLYTEGVVTKHGRDRYAIAPDQLSSQSLDARWKSLPQTGKTG